MKEGKIISIIIKTILIPIKFAVYAKWVLEIVSKLVTMKNLLTGSTSMFVPVSAIKFTVHVLSVQYRYNDDL